MPIYEYQCTKCGHQLEAFQGISEAPLTECPQCHQPALTKLISAAGFQLKGTGWYVTDYSKKGKEKQPKAENNAASDTAETKSTAETTPAASTATSAAEKKSSDSSSGASGGSSS